MVLTVGRFTNHNAMVTKPNHKRKELYSKKWYDRWVNNNPDNNIPSGNDDSVCSESKAQNSMRSYLSNC